MIPVDSPIAATVASVLVETGQTVTEGATLLYLEIMKMEHPITAPTGGRVDTVEVAVGQDVAVGQRLMTLQPTHDSARPDPGSAPADVGDAEAGRLGQVESQRVDLAEVIQRRRLLTDAARPATTAARHKLGFRTARENLADLLDDGSFSEYGGLAIAAQRTRRSMEELLERTPADGLVTGTGTINGDLFGPDASQVAVAAYDYSVLAGTQGWTNHHKKDRIFAVAARLGLPVVVFAEGGGGRPGDTDVVGGSWLDVPAFEIFAGLSGQVPTVAIVNGRCFAGNAALAGCADVIIATRGSNLGMAGPAMIEGGGLGVVASEDIGPMDVQAANGVVDIVVEDEAEAVATTRKYLAYTQGRTATWDAVDQARLRDLVPANRKRVYDMRELLDTVADADSVLELRPDHAPGMLTAFARMQGRPVGTLANIPTHLGGAIDAAGADVAARHLQLCDAYGLPVLVLCDTPGFMVGPEAEKDGGVRRFSRMFVAGAAMRVPVLAVITRKAYGLGAMAMLGGQLKTPVLTLGWPTAELGPMGLEGAVVLGSRRELDAIADPDERQRREDVLVEEAHAGAKGLNVATYAEIDDVIDPTDTRLRIGLALDAMGPQDRSHPRRFIDPR